MHAQLMNLGWSSTYMGAVSYMKLVSTTTILCTPVHFCVSEEDRQLKQSKSAFMFANRSPMFAPIAIALW